MLYGLYWDLVDDHGCNHDAQGAWDTGGNNLRVQLVTDDIEVPACKPGFVDGRDASSR